MPSKEFPGRLDVLPAIGKYVTGAARQAGLNDKEIYFVELAVVEACTNIIEHGYHYEGEQKIICTWVKIEQGIKIVLKDTARAFDPRKAPQPQFGVSLENLRKRGVGVYLMLNLMDDVQHEYIPGEGNVLTLIKRPERREPADRQPERGLPGLRRAQKPPHRR